jgi:hypothetical protein
MTKRKDDTLSNFIPINRKFFDHPFWKEERTFSKSEAWMDLIVSARFEESKATELIGGKLVSWTRGQLPASLRYLAERWKWSKNKVDDFLKLLENEMMIERILSSGQTVLFLKNYETYNGRHQKGQHKGQLKEPQYNGSVDGEDSKKDTQKDKRGTAGGQPRDKSNIENIGNKEEDDLSGANAPVYSQGDQEMFKAFQGWIDVNAPKVAKMKEPITIGQYIKLRNKLTKDQVKDLLLKMHNYGPLLKNNDVAYLTIINWSKRDYNQPKEGKDANEQYLQKRKAAEEQVRQRAEN